jgi:hypothetical protein
MPSNLVAAVLPAFRSCRWDTGCCAFNSVIAFTWLYWFQIVRFVLSAASVDAWYAWITEGVCKSDVAILACCGT